MLIIYFYMVIIKTYKVEKFFNKFRNISGNFLTHNPTQNLWIANLEPVARNIMATLN